ncbi:MAG: TlpA family protein disulfide reductase [Prevotellaceae bacterium]|jgi:peroxiredoxin|nr:TlpA family protein disulfide reductase [Prevotellaceae bacterium]
MSLAFVFACSPNRRISSSPDVASDITPYISVIDNCLENMIVQTSGSIIHAVDSILTETVNDTVKMKSLTRHIFDKYFQPIDDDGDTKIMGMENVAVHIIDNYYLTGKAGMDDKEYLNKIIDYANKNRETLTGKQAKNLKMETITGGAESLYDIDSPYILLCFFDASCAHCQHEIPEIYKIFKKFKNNGLAGFCVYARNDKNEWVQFVYKYKLTDWINVWDPTNVNDFRIAYSLYSVPQVYVLDKDRKIVGRRLESASLKQFLNDLINNNDK